MYSHLGVSDEAVAEFTQKTEFWERVLYWREREAFWEGELGLYQRMHLQGCEYLVNLGDVKSQKSILKLQGDRCQGKRLNTFERGSVGNDMKEVLNVRRLKSAEVAQSTRDSFQSVRKWHIFTG